MQRHREDKPPFKMGAKWLKALTMVLKACCSCCCRRSRPQATHSPWQSQCPGLKTHASRTTRHHRGIFIAQHTWTDKYKPEPSRSQHRDSPAGESWDVLPVVRGCSLQSRQSDNTKLHQSKFIEMIKWFLCGQSRCWKWKSVQPGHVQSGWRAQPEAINEQTGIFQRIGIILCRLEGRFADWFLCKSGGWRFVQLYTVEITLKAQHGSNPAAATSTTIFLQVVKALIAEQGFKTKWGFRI